jgi:hypothetical protein
MMTRDRLLAPVLALGVLTFMLMLVLSHGCKTTGASTRPSFATAPVSCPEGFRPFVLKNNSATQTVWIGMTAGAAPPPFVCTTNDDCGPNQVCNNPRCQNSADCNFGNMCDTNTGQCMVAPGTQCNGGAPITTVNLPGWECTGAKQVASCSGCGDAGCDQTTGLCLCSAGNSSTCPSGTTCSNTAQECSLTHGGTCFFQQVAPGESTACNATTSCPSGQTCNLLLGLCQYEGDGGIPGDALELTAGESTTICMPASISPTSVFAGRQAGLTSCTQDSDCQSNRCLQASGGNILNPPTSCAPDGGTPCLCRQVIGWSGGIFGRTGCQDGGSQCLSADCSSSAGQQCPIGKGGANPFTSAEFTLQPTAPDFYDITIINGVNLAIQMGPLPGSFAPPATPSPYYCGTAGASEQDGGLQGCSWSFSPDQSSGLDGGFTAMLKAVVLPACSATGGCAGSATCTSAVCQPALTPCNTSPPYCSGNAVCSNPNDPANGYCSTCQSDSDCASNPAGSACGTAFLPGVGNKTPLIQTCGQPIGWWSYEDLCTALPGFSYGPLNCNQLAPAQGGVQDTFTNLFKCSGQYANSCYNSGSGNVPSCCGCATFPSNPARQYWPTVLQAGNNPQQADAGQCLNNNPSWATYIQPWLAFLKQGCPTAYTYAFDDVTSTFTCLSTDATTDGGINSVGYQLTFGDLN